MIINSTAEDIVYTACVSGVHGNFLRPSLEAMGITEEFWKGSKKMDFGDDFAKAEAKATAIAKFNAQLQESVAEEQRKTAEFNAKTNQVVQDYGAKIQKYTAIVGEETQRFNGSLQKSAQILSEASALMAIVGQLNTQCQMAMQESQDFYQRSTAELRAISGVLTAPPQQQKEQRQEQGSTS